MSELIIFDCDGVLVDSEILSAQVAREMAAERGVAVNTGEALELIHGRKVAEWVAELETMAGARLRDSFVAEFRRRTAQRFARELRPVPGVAQILRDLDTTFCVASSAPMEKIRYVLTLTGLLRYVDGRIYSAYDHQTWKPDPDLFLRAADDFGCLPARCAVIEDSLVGVRAGVSAAMTVFGYAPPDTGAPAGRLATALAAAGATTFTTMTELPRLLAHWRNRQLEIPVCQ